MSFVDDYNSMPDGQSTTLPAIKQNSLSYSPPQQSAKKKGPGGVTGFLVNALPAIGGGLGAIAGIPGDVFSAGASSVGGGAVGAGFGEALKRKILGENLDPKQIAIQAAEGGAGAAAGGLIKGASGIAKNIVGNGVKTVAKDVAETGAEDTAKTGNSFLKNLTTQGQQAQGRVAGVSAGTKVGTKELVPQDTTKMLQTLKNEGINTGNANNTLRDVTDKMSTYGQQIADHFKTNDAPLHPDDTKQIADNFISSLKTSDPSVLKKADVLATDLQNNVKSTKDLWEFRKGLDKTIPASKQGTTEGLSNKIIATKSMRDYLANELGDVPGMKNYHDLAEVKPFISKEALRLNNPGGGIAGRLLASGPVQKLENAGGKIIEKVGSIGDKTNPEALQATENTAPTNILEKVLTKKGIPVKYESDTLVGKGIQETKNSTLTNPNIADLENKIAELKGKGFSVNQQLGRTPGSSLPTGVGITHDFTPLEQSPRLSSVALTGKKTAIPLSQEGSIEKGIINTPDEYKMIQPDVQSAPTPVGSGFLNKLLKTSKSIATLPVRAAAVPLAYPGKAAVQVGKQELLRGGGIPAAISQAQQSQGNQSDQQSPDISGAILDSTNQQTDTSNDPFSPENVQANVQSIMSQGGTMKDVSDYLSNVKAYQDLTTSSAKPLNSTQQQQANNANSGLSDIQSLSDMLSKDPSLTLKSALPGGSIVERLTGTTDFDAAKSNIVDVISRLRSGAAISATEEKTYKSLLPAAGDSAESANSKLQRLTSLLSSFANPQSSGGSDITDLLANGS